VQPQRDLLGPPGGAEGGGDQLLGFVVGRGAGEGGGGDEGLQTPAPGRSTSEVAERLTGGGVERLVSVLVEPVVVAFQIQEPIDDLARVQPLRWPATRAGLGEQRADGRDV
jgi:hypothetical protein